MAKAVKIINDPIYGFITIPDGLIHSLLEHPYFQRLRRISQMGLSYMVYPGAHHTRFQHSVGAMYLAGRAVDALRAKSVEITGEEKEGLQIALLLHDIGHGPFSHALEGIFGKGKSHEQITLMYMHWLNDLFDGRLEVAMEIFTKRYPKKFLHALLSGQLDVDRLDYLKRDSFYTGVVEGSINSDRLISMMNVSGDELVVESKGIFSIEKFLLSRRFMYWQVYFHKTGLLAERVLYKILLRAKDLIRRGEKVLAPEHLLYFLRYSGDLQPDNNEFTERFSYLDDHDIWVALKMWLEHPDPVLSKLSKMLLYRRLPKIEFSDTPFDTDDVDKIRQACLSSGIDDSEVEFFTWQSRVGNKIYDSQDGGIQILTKSGEVKEWLEMVPQYDSERFTHEFYKYYLVSPR